MLLLLILLILLAVKQLTEAAAYLISPRRGYI
jgi:hypothetical protein